MNFNLTGKIKENPLFDEKNFERVNVLERTSIQSAELSDSIEQMYLQKYRSYNIKGYSEIFFEISEKDISKMKYFYKQQII